MGKELLLDDHRELRGEGRALVGWIRDSSEQICPNKYYCIS